MGNKIIIALVITIALLITSCSKDTKELFSSYTDKYGKLSEYKIVYNVDSKGIQGDGNFDIKVGTFKKDDNEKNVIEFKVYGESPIISVYNVDGRSIACTENQYTGSSENVECFEDEIGDFSVYNQFTDNAYLFTKIDTKESEIKYDSTQELIGRKCDKFSVEIKNLGKLLGEDRNSIFYQQSNYQNMPAIMQLCLDKSTGLPLSTKIFTKQKSELDEKDTGPEIISYTATSYTGKVDDTVFNLPENTCYSLKTKEQCDSSELNCDWDGKTCGTKSFLPSKCLMQAGLACLDHKATANSLAFVMINSLGFDIQIDAVKAQQCTALGSQGMLANGMQATYTLKCANEGSKYNGQVNITYTVIDTGLQHTNQGYISARLE